MKTESTSLEPVEYLLDALSLDRENPLPLHRQLYQQLRDLVLQGRIRSKARLPSTRALATELSVSRNTVTAAYGQLESEGYLDTRQGSRPILADLLVKPARDDGGSGPNASADISRRGRLMVRPCYQRGSPGRVAFHPGTPDMREFPFATWQRLAARRLHAGGHDVFGYHYVDGFPPLRSAIADYLGAARGVRCTAEQIVVTTGAQAAFDLLARLLLDPGDTVWMEEPGYAGARNAFLAAGARLAPLRVDAAGWHVDPVAAARMRLVYVTPSCQAPLGLTMRMEERMRLIEAARARNAWIIEDDFDSEYRFGGRTVAAMQGVDSTGRTIYVGTFSKTMFPALRIGFMVLPQQLGATINNAVFLSGTFAPLFLQGALSDFIGQGHFARHVRRMRRLYAARRSLFMELCGHYLGQWLEPLPGDAGIQTVWRLRPPLGDRDIVLRARRLGIDITPLSASYQGVAALNGLIFGYAAVDEATMHAGLKRLRSVFEDAAAPVRSRRRRGANAS
jgi:GntR family transcriptional regulator/MocR family aminotransferase